MNARDALLLALFVSLVMSLITIAAYSHDKRASRRGRRRIPERTLHTLEALGGWPGGVLGRRLLRHKTRSRGFLLTSWVIIAFHAAGWFFVARAFAVLLHAD